MRIILYERKTLTKKVELLQKEKEKERDERQEQKVKNEWHIGIDDTSSFKVTLFVM